MNTPNQPGTPDASFEQRLASRTDIHDWRPEDEQFWESTGKRIAYRNLWISIPALLCGFAAFYAACLVLNWWFYLRRGAEIRNP